MKKIFILLAFLTSCAHIQVNPTEIRQSAVKSVVMVHGTMLFGGYTATGFSVKSDSNGTDFLTNKHACVPGAEITVTDSDNKTYKSAIVRVSDLDDLCLLHSDEAQIPALPLATKDAEYGVDVEVIGCGHAICQQITHGITGKYVIINMTGSTEIHSREQLLTAVIYPGNSGSCVLDADGNVVGIINIGYNGAPTISIMVPVELIHRFISEPNKNVNL